MNLVITTMVGCSRGAGGGGLTDQMQLGADGIRLDRQMQASHCMVVVTKPGVGAARFDCPCSTGALHDTGHVQCEQVDPGTIPWTPID